MKTTQLGGLPINFVKEAKNDRNICCNRSGLVNRVDSFINLSSRGSGSIITSVVDKTKIVVKLAMK